MRPAALAWQNKTQMPTQKKAVKTNQIRSANPDAIRATVYLPPKLYAAITQRWHAERKQAREAANGTKGIKRVTLSDVIIRACDEYLR